MDKLIVVVLTETESDDLLAELDHDDNGMGGGLSPLGLKIEAIIKRAKLQAVEV